MGNHSEEPSRDWITNLYRQALNSELTAHKYLTLIDDGNRFIRDKLQNLKTESATSRLSFL